MYYKCYFHNKTDGAHLCRGCKLPICDECQHDLGFCPECMRKRDAVDDLRNLRKNVAAKSKIASSTTARLRLAIRQAGPIARRGRVIGDTQLMGTGTLNANDWQDASMAMDARVPRHFKDMMDQRKAGNQWTYDPDRVAYRGVNGAGGKAESPTRKAPVERRPVAGRVHRAQPVVALPSQMPNWAKPFVMGLGVGLVVVLGATFGQGLLKTAPKAKAKPIFSQTDSADKQLIAQANGTDEASVKARSKAAARRALMNEAFAEADGVARRVAADEAAQAAAYRAAARAAEQRSARLRYAAPAAGAPAPAAPVVHTAAPAPRVTYSRPAAPAAPVYHPLPVLGDGARGITIRSESSNRGAWQKSGGMLVTSW